ncbi:hypothetical protein FQ377_01395 [Arthrobacter echini]|uniref:STAS/SEC14 domain-containing protein n=1 Tax=Arthrobacter echini TaxID=1529066 RepID=A0A5D0XU94_9MICC|nr:hypothetical protein [Arthrobacter echini]TYD00151.1 hypothetical protein FQ377_01395 [Arthrobacter echini]
MTADSTAQRSEPIRHVLEHCEILDHRRWMEVVLRAGHDVTDADLLVFRAGLREVADWQSKPMLIHMRSLLGVSLEGRARISRYRHPTRIAVMGNSPMDEIIASFTLRSPSRTEYFSDRLEALRWLGVAPPH